MEPFHLLADSPIYIELSASPAYSFENHWHQAAITRMSKSHMPDYAGLRACI
jgi:hypothetical protein